MGKTFDTLYKKTNTGAIQTWVIKVEGNVIYTVYGQLGGKMQETSDTIKEGKNVGKANGTTAESQAELEAAAKYQKQLKRGYVTSMGAAEKGEVDDVIGGGLAPMLAPSKIYPVFANKLAWPVLTQPKLDGSRLISTPKDKNGSLWSRTRKQVKSLPHIAKAIEEQLGNYNHTWDGEAYDKEYADQNGFEGLMSAIRKDEPSAESERVNYYIYDVPSLGHLGNAERDKLRLEMLKNVKLPLVVVPTVYCNNHEEVIAEHLRNIAAGYEGTMIRSNTGTYEMGKRSYFLQKLKDRKDSEFKILDAEEGRGKDVGTVGAFLCETHDHKPFKCRLKATYERRRELFNHSEQWRGWRLTVMYQELTSDGIPRFPIGKSLRKSTE
jgi:ATP-dependent DNA ligase